MRSLLSAALSTVLTAVLAAGLVATVQPVAAAQPVEAVPSTYTAVTPVRVLDTRTGAGPVAPRGTVTVNLSARLPASATAVVLNVTGIAGATGTYVTAYPAGSPRPLASNLNLRAGETRPNLVTVALGTNRSVQLYNNTGSTHLLADLAGYYATGAGAKFTARSPERVVRTQAGPRGVAVVDLSTRVPASATAVVVNVTGTQATAGTYVTAWPTGTTRPVTSTLNLPAGQTSANLAVVPLGTGRRISLYNNAGSIDLLVDLAGFYTPEFGASFTPLTPVRILDTRDGTGTGGEIRPLGPRETRPVQAWPDLPGRAVAAVLNVTGVAPTAGTYLSLWQGEGNPTPSTSTVNLTPGQVASNLAVTTTRGEEWSERAHLFNNAGTTHAVADLAGYFWVPPAECGPGCAYVWGANEGNLGIGTTNYVEEAPTPLGLSDVVDADERVAVRADGTVWTWGTNQHGELGGGWLGGESTVPVRVPGLTGVVAAGNSSRATVALRSDGTVWAWGENYSGQLGDATLTHSAVPVRIPGLTGVTAIATSTGNVYALRSDGSVWAWGNNFFGQLGNGTTGGPSYTPTRVSGLDTVVAVAEAYTTGYALLADGTVRSWGANWTSELGQGSAAEQPVLVPAPVVGLTGIVDIAGDQGNGYAVRDDGTVWAWGTNALSALGNGQDCQSTPGAPECEAAVPVQVSGLTGVVDVVGGGDTGYALRSDGSVWAWGGNYYGELGGAGETFYSTVPVRVPGLTGISAVRGGSQGGRALTG